MPVIINQSDDRVLLRFNSGATHTLGPREKLEVEHVEVKGNERILHLETRRRIAIERGEDGGRAGERRRPAPAGEEGVGDGMVGEGGGAPRLSEPSGARARPRQRAKPKD